MPDDRPSRPAAILFFAVVAAAAAAFVHAWWPLAVDAVRFLARLVR